MKASACCRPSWDRSEDQSEVLGLVLGPGPSDRGGKLLRAQVDSQDRSRDQSWNRSWESTFCAFATVRLCPPETNISGFQSFHSLIHSSCIPRRYPLQEARTGGRGSADFYGCCSTYCRHSGFQMKEWELPQCILGRPSRRFSQTACTKMDSFGFSLVQAILCHSYFQQGTRDMFRSQ